MRKVVIDALLHEIGQYKCRNLYMLLKSVTETISRHKSNGKEDDWFGHKS